MQVDKGAIKFILSGANIMCPGLTSKGARMDTSLPANTVVVSSLLKQLMKKKTVNLIHLLL